MAESLESGITCPLCLDIYQDPKVLPCGHIYCRDPCLTGLARRSNNTAVSCPECRKVAQIPRGDVSAFPTVYKIVSLVDSFKAKDTREGTDQPDSSIRECQLHAGQEIALYCETCSKAFCRDCMLTTREHKDHQFSYIKDVAAKSREYLLAQSRQAENCCKTLKHALESIQAAIERISARHDVISREIDTQVEMQLEKHRVTLHSQLDHITKLKLDHLNTQYLRLTEAQVGLEKTSAIVENVTDNFSDVDLMLEMKQLHTMLEKMTLEDTHTLECNVVTNESIGICSDSSMATVRQVFLYSGEPADPSKCTFESKDLIKDVQIGKVVKIHIEILESSGKVCPEKQDVTVELHCLRDLSAIQLEAKCIKPAAGLYFAEITLTDRGRNMLAVKVNGKHIVGSPTPMFVHMPPQKLGAPIAVIEGLKRPAGLHKWNGQILACEHENNQLRRIDSKHEIACLVMDLKHDPCELSSDSSLNIYVTTYKNSCVHKLDKFGQVLKTTGSRGSRKDQFDFPNGVTVRDNKVYICDTNNHRIKVYDLDLNLIDIIGRKGTKLGQFQSPGDLAFDKDGNMYVAEQDNNRIQVLSPLKKSLRNHSLDRPVTVYFNNWNEYLYVTEFNKHCVRVITTSGDFIANFGNGYLHHPEGLEIDDDGFVYVTSHQSKILVF